ncbi:MAG: hypothetical protein NZM31_12715 [Gemmatales bacterium]|nr:hypothetical protein [Gemmatales bacterium]MDW8387857.1 hypothetical protein [Gemmatales bacterium]
MKTRNWLLVVGLLAPSLMSGCATTWHDCCVDNCATIPPGAQPAPNGTYVQRFRDVQAAKAEADDFVIYKYEWSYGTAELGPFGQYHVNEMVKRLPFVPFPVLIQAHTTDGELNQRRREYVVRLLEMNGIADAEQRVVLGFPEAEGLYGEEAPRIYGMMLMPQTGMFGGLGGFGLGGWGGFGGLGGFGFPGWGGGFGGFFGFPGFGGFGTGLGW